MWNPKQYGKFLDYRSRPSIDLINNIPDLEFSSIIDLGCGIGNVTQLLQNKYPNASITGLDNSVEMLDKARLSSSEINWQIGNITDFNSAYDLVFSTAALQWVHDHQIIFPKILENVRKVLAIQMPNNFNYPSHVLLRETIYENKKWHDKLKHILREQPVLSLSEYFSLLNDKVAHVDIWETQYLHQLTGENAVLEWVRGTALVPIAANLSSSEFNEFVEIYRVKLRQEYKMLVNGVTLFPFARIFIIATK